MKDRDGVNVAATDTQILYQRYEPEIRRYLARRLHCEHTAADLTQETFLRLLRQGGVSVLEKPRAYLYRIAANLLTDHRRRMAALTVRGDASALERAPCDAPGQDRVVLARAELARLQVAVNALPARQREVFIMHKYDGLSYGEIAAQLGISKNTVMVHMMKALAYCRDAMADRN